jgi:hypothetical protein
MKTAATGIPVCFGKPEGMDRSYGTIRWPIDIHGKSAKQAVRVVFVLDEGDVLWMLSELQAIAEARAKAHDQAAEYLRRAAHP